MRNFTFRVCIAICAVILFHAASAQTKTNTAILKQAAVQQAGKEKLLKQQLQVLAKEKGWELVIRGKKGYTAVLVGVDDAGMPLYLATENNIVAAATIGTNKLWPGGATGLNLNGSSNNLKNKLALWDGDKVLSTHVELAGRVVQRDGTTIVSDHSTHVAGTMIASGVNPLAKGMSFGQQELVAYDFDNHISEMLNEADNLLVSNHSYGAIAGWSFNVNQNRWEFWGEAGSNEDYKFGYYSIETQIWDSIAYNAPYYLIVKSSGNKRDENGPAVGGTYWRYNASNVMVNAGPRPANISDNDTFDIIPTYGIAKNILTVGAINPISSGYSRPEDAVQATFSSWGPTDDGRIKPDVVADGVGLLSSVGPANNNYDTYSGTSMATPNASGSLMLLQEYYSQLHAGTFLRSASLKGLVIHTADETGIAPGPDYKYGWGLINMAKAAAVITGDNAANPTNLIRENVLNNGGTFSLPVIASGNGTISATLCWTDPKHPVVIPVATALNNPAKKLVNDLDIVIKKGATTYRSWKLNPATPNAAATTGDNTLDNVEKIEITDVVPGDSYTIEVTHKGTLERGSQAYSLIVSGVGSQAYCASAPGSSAGARIDSVSFADIRNKNAAGCTTYSNFTSLTGNVQPGQTLPFFVRLNSCDATNVDKIVKIFIDANNDGDFTDANETIATSAVINGNGDFNTNITIPAGLSKGQYTLIRVVMQETNVAANVTACGTYTRGETQDYRILLVDPALDFGVTELVAPSSANCTSGEQYVSIRIRNFGTADKKNIPLTAVIKQGATTVATLTATYPDTIYANTTEVYTFQTPFNMAGGTAYTITAHTSFTGDQAPGNDQNITTFTSRANSTDPAGTAVICGTSAQLRVTNPVAADYYNWYTSPSAVAPIAAGASTSTATLAANYYLSKNELKKLGPVNKQVFPDGGYNIFVNNVVKLTTVVPVHLETARLYIGHSGKITFFFREVVTENPDGSYSYYPITSKTIDVYATAPTPPALGAQINDPADLGAIYHLGVDLPAANNIYVVIQCENGASIFRNNNITTNPPGTPSPYPFVIPNIMSINSNSAADFQNYYYFFYNMSVKLNACPSSRANIVPTTAVAPTISIAGNVLTSTPTTGTYQWYKDGGIIPTETGQTYTATAAGIYTVRTTLNGCTLTSNQINFTPTAVPNVDPSQIGLIVSPVPSKGDFKIQLETRTKSDLDIALLNTTGQRVYHTIMPDFIGQLSKDIMPGKIAAGVYYLRIMHDKKMYIRKIVVVQ